MIGGGILSFQLLGAAFAAMGTAMAVFGSLATRRARRSTAVARRAPGRVVGHRADDHGGPGEVELHQHPVVEYRAPDGRPVSFQHPVGSTPPAFRVGEEVTVITTPPIPTTPGSRRAGAPW